MDTCIDTALSLCALLAPDAQVQAHPPLEGGGVVCVWGGGTAVTYSSLLDLACQVLRARRRYSVYLLYWYTSTNTDAACAARRSTASNRRRAFELGMGALDTLLTFASSAAEAWRVEPSAEGAGGGGGGSRSGGRGSSVEVDMKRLGNMFLVACASSVNGAEAVELAEAVLSVLVLLAQK